MLQPKNPGEKDKSPTHIEDVHAALVDKKALEQALDDHEPLAEHQHGGVDQRARAAMEDEEEQKLGQEGESKQQKVDQEGDEGQRKQASNRKREELGMAQEVPDAADRIPCRLHGARRVARHAANRAKK